MFPGLAAPCMFLWQRSRIPAIFALCDCLPLCDCFAAGGGPVCRGAAEAKRTLCYLAPFHSRPSQEAAQSAEVLAALQKRNEELAASKDGEAVADLQM